MIAVQSESEYTLKGVFMFCSECGVENSDGVDFGSKELIYGSLC